VGKEGSARVFGLKTKKLGAEKSLGKVQWMDGQNKQGELRDHLKSTPESFSRFEFRKNSHFIAETGYKGICNQQRGKKKVNI
jgi:ATP:corrinoid adenosyltransferase